MSREIRSRRAGLSRDQARQQPLYARLLGLQYLMPSGFLCFVFLEGAVALGVLLALAELVSWWGVLVLPVTVAAMVKLNDAVAGAVSRPVASVPRAAAPRTSAVRAPAADPSPDSFWTSDAAVDAAWDNVRGDASDTRSFPAVPTPSLSGSGSSDSVSAPAVRRAAMQAPTVDLRPAAAAAMRTRTAVSTDASALNGPPVARQWGSRADQFDHQEQRSRQAASRRYE
jgi:hypothetical protein